MERPGENPVMVILGSHSQGRGSGLILARNQSKGVSESLWGILSNLFWIRPFELYLYHLTFNRARFSSPPDAGPPG